MNLSDSSLNFSDSIILTDICNKTNQRISYKKVRDANYINVEEARSSSSNFCSNLKIFLKDVFLPRGYPHSVSSDYLEYQIWDTCQAFCSSISGTLTMRAVMQGIGVGSKAATPVSAAITWIFKDGTGIIGSILFAWLKGSKLDSDCKKWRLFADVLNDVAMLIELYIPFVIKYSTYMLCLSTFFKALVGTAGSSTRAAVVTHQAVDGNIADVSAKDGSQEFFVNLCAFIFGILILKHVTEIDQVWAMMCTTTLFHIIFNYKAVKSLKINIFNSDRFCLGLRTYLPTSTVPTVQQVNKKESVFLNFGLNDKAVCGYSISFGVCLKKVLENEKITSQRLNTLTALFEDKNYLILSSCKKKKLFISFRENFTNTEVLKAYFHASLIGIGLTHLNNGQLSILTRSRKHSPIYRLKNIITERFSGSEAQFITDNQSDESILMIYIICEDLIEKEFAAFSNACEKVGWNLNKHLITVGDWRAEWKHLEEKKKNYSKSHLPGAVKSNSNSVRRKVTPSGIGKGGKKSANVDFSPIMIA